MMPQLLRFIDFSNQVRPMMTEENAETYYYCHSHILLILVVQVL